MKTNLIYLAIFTSISFFYSCEKQPFDYRNKVIGKYLFVTKRQEYVQGTSFLILDSIYTVGTIEYGPNSDELLVKYAPNEQFVWKVKEVDFYKDINGCYFSNDNDEFRMHYFRHQGGMGAAKNHWINGLRMHN